VVVYEQSLSAMRHIFEYLFSAAIQGISVNYSNHNQAPSTRQTIGAHRQTSRRQFKISKTRF